MIRNPAQPEDIGFIVNELVGRQHILISDGRDQLITAM